jgi:Family of unknown function (DUF6232)
MPASRFEIVDSIVYVGGSSYPLGAISSLRVDTQRPGGRLGSFLIVGGVIAMMVSAGSGSWITTGVLMICFGLAFFRPVYLLYIRTAGGEASVLKSYKSGEVNAVRRAIEGAVNARDNPEVSDDPAEGIKDRQPCPHCAELILRAAKVCRFCGRDVPPVLTQLPGRAG